MILYGTIQKVCVFIIPAEREHGAEGYLLKEDIYETYDTWHR